MQQLYLTIWLDIFHFDAESHMEEKDQIKWLSANKWKMTINHLNIHQKSAFLKWTTFHIRSSYWLSHGKNTRRYISCGTRFNLINAKNNSKSVQSHRGVFSLFFHPPVKSKIIGLLIQWYCTHVSIIGQRSLSPPILRTTITLRAVNHSDKISRRMWTMWHARTKRVGV